MRERSVVSIAAASLLAAPSLAHAEVREVSDVAALRAAVEAANPGDVIELAGGTYRLDGKLRLDRPGEEGAPITLRGAAGQRPLIEVDAVEGLNVRAPHWTIEGVHMVGVCADDSQCEHALHIVGAADHTIVRDNVLQNFNAQIKANGEEDAQGVRVWPDDVLIEGNELFNDAPRQTSNPVTPIDVVGGRRWVVRANYIHDHAKAQGNTISYAAFLKGNSRDGLFERNLVACEQLHSGQVRLGLSFGGGGSGPDPICEDATCTPEHQGGVMRNNLIVNCPADVGIYLNEAAGTLLEHNTLYNTTGIDARFDTTDVVARDNLLMGKIRERNGGAVIKQGNLEQISREQMRAWFADPDAVDFSLVDGAAIVDQASGEGALMDDYCGLARGPARDVGALEYTSNSPCDTSTVHPVTAVTPAPGEDMGVTSPSDMGGEVPGEDMGAPGMEDDMGAVSPGEDMSSSIGEDMSSPGEDMSASAPEQGDESSSQDEGCQHTPAGAPASPAWLVASLGVLGMRRRRARG